MLALTRRSILTCFALSLSLCLTGAATAGQIHVPGDFGAVTAALGSAASGDTVIVAPGLYAPSTTGENFPLRFSLDDLTVLGAGMGVSVLDAEGTHRIANFSTPSGGRLSGFTITGGVQTNGGGIIVQQGNPEIDNNFILANGAADLGAGIVVFGSATPWIHHNVLWENYDTNPDDEEDPHGIVCSATTTGIVEHNLIGLTDGNGLLTGSNSYPIIRHNILLANGQAGPPRRGRGICIFGSPDQIQAYHNLFHDNELAALLIPDLGGDVSGEDANDIDPDDGIYGNLDGDPLLVDPDNFDFHLTADSPAIDNGRPDLPGDPDGTVADIGPFFFDQTVSALQLPAAGLAILPSAPNPFNPGTEILFTLDRAVQARVDIFAVDGRLVRRLFAGTAEAGLNRVFWNGADGAGRTVAAGVYLARAQTATEQRFTALTLVK